MHGDAPNTEETGNGRLSGHAVLVKLSYAFLSDVGAVREGNEDFVRAYAPGTPDDSWDRGMLLSLPMAWEVMPPAKWRAASRWKRCCSVGPKVPAASRIKLCAPPCATPTQLCSTLRWKRAGAA